VTDPTPDRPAGGDDDQAGGPSAPDTPRSGAAPGPPGGADPDAGLAVEPPDRADPSADPAVEPAARSGSTDVPPPDAGPADPPPAGPGAIDEPTTGVTPTAGAVPAVEPPDRLDPSADAPVEPPAGLAATTDGDDQTDDDGEPPGPPGGDDDDDRSDDSDEEAIRPEVGRPRSGGGGFFARMAAAQASANATRQAADLATPPTDGGGRRSGRIVRIGCTVLALIGALGAFSGIRLLTDVDGAICNNARAIILDEDDDAEEDEVDDLDCPAAIERAGAFEDGPDVPTEGQAQFQGGLLLAVGVFQVAAGLLLQRRLVRRNRAIALGATAFAVLIPVLGTISLVLALFVAYAIGFSADSRAVFGLGRGFGARRRPDAPPPEPAA
jgi:hypothetical protein